MSGLNVIEIKKNVLAKNDILAAENRKRFADSGVTALNLVSSPGAGKTTLLAKTLLDIKDQIRCAVIEGDQQTANDAERIAETGVAVTQINTISACHLDAYMVSKVLGDFALSELDLMFIENVGNLVCPASYDLGEDMKIALMSTTEGEDKPIKYPKMFRVSKAMVLTKTDLLPYLDFDADKAIDYALKVNPDLKIFKVSTKNGAGLSEWYEWLSSLTKRK